MKTIDLTSIIKKYTTGWIALRKDYGKVVAHAKDYQSLEKKLDKEGIKDVVLMPAAKNYRGFVT